MDRINRALLCAEHNSERLDALEHGMAGYVKRYASVAVAAASPVSEGEAVRSVFGSFESAGGAAIVTFDGAGESVLFCGSEIASGVSPVIAALPAGKGELAVGGEHGEARALIIGHVKKIN